MVPSVRRRALLAGPPSRACADTVRRLSGEMPDAISDEWITSHYVSDVRREVAAAEGWGSCAQPAAWQRDMKEIDAIERFQCSGLLAGEFPFWSVPTRLG